MEIVKRTLVLITVSFGLAGSAAAQNIKVTPSNVTVYSQGATTVFLTFANVLNKRPADACWCGELVSAAPDIGFKCKPGAEFGCLPVRYNQSSLNINGAYTDIMSVPASVARRAYIDAASGAEATFYYVRRFVSTVGGPDEYVTVTLRLSGNGASVPFSLTDVRLTWGVDKPVILLKRDEKLPKLQAEIRYTGTGRLKGRWELVKPGEDLPESRDLLTEGTLPPEERGKQRRYTELSRFNVFLAPVGRFVLPGPEAWRVPSHLEGRYAVLLRIESVDDASLGSSGTGGEPVATGGVAGFSMPVLRYYVGAGTGVTAGAPVQNFSLDSPEDGAVIRRGTSLLFGWTTSQTAAFYRIEFSDSRDAVVLSAVVPAGVTTYRAPSWLKDKLEDGRLFWKVVALDRGGNPVRETPRRMLRLAD